MGSEPHAETTSTSPSSDQEQTNWASAFAGGVSFWMKTFTMTCPGVGKWFEENKLIETDPEEQTLTVEYKDRRKYHCEYGSDGNKEKYYFYVQGKGE